MNGKKKIVLILISTIFFLSASIFVVILYWQYRGLPQGVQRYFWHQLQAEGLIGDAEEIKAGLFGGVVLKNLVIRDYLLPEWTLLTADTLEIKFDFKSLVRGTFRVAHVEVSGCAVSVPLELSGDTVLQQIVLTDLSCLIRDAGDRLNIASFHGLVEGIRLKLGGDIIKPTEEELRRLRLKNKDFELKLSMLPWIRLLTLRTVEQIVTAQEFCRSTQDFSKATVSLDMQLRAGDLSKSQLTINAFFSNFLYRGLKLDTLLLIGDVTEDEINLSELNLKMDNGEYLNGNFNFDIKNNNVSGQLRFHGYPEKLLKALSPDLLVALPINFPDFSDVPVSAKITLHPSIADNPSDWKLDIELNLADTNIVDATVKSFAGEFHYENRLVTLTRCKAVVAPDVQISATGSCSLDDGGIHLEAAIDGDPHFVSLFSTDEKFKKGYNNVWRDFEWQKDESPHFDVVLQRDKKFPRSGLLVQVRSTMQNVVYNDVHVDRAEGTVLVDFPEALVLIDNLKVTRDNASAWLNLAWHEKRKHVDFDLDGTFDPPALLGLFNRDRIDFLEGVGLIFNDNPQLTATGHIDLVDSGRTRIDVSISGPSMNYKNASLYDFNAEVSIKQDETNINGTIAEIQYSDWTAFEVTPQLKIGPDRTTISGKIMTLAGLGVNIGSSDFEVLCTEESIDVTSNSAFVKFGDGRFNHVQATSVYKNQRLTTSATGKTAELFQFGVNNVSVDFIVFDEQIVADLLTDESVAGQDYEFSNIRGSCVIRDDYLSFTGNIAELRHIPTNSYSSNVVVDCGYSDSYLDTVFYTASVASDDGSVTALKLTLRRHNGSTEGDYSVGSLTFGEGYRGRNVYGDFQLNDGQYEFQSAWATVTTPVCQLLHANINGTYTPGRWSASVEANQCVFDEYPFDEFSATLLLKNNDLLVNRVTANLFGGRATGEYFYDYTEDSAKLWLTLVGADFTRLTQTIGSMDDEVKTGSFSGKVDLNISDVSGESRIDGKGKVVIDDGDFWKVPLLSDFMAMVGHIGILGMVLPGGGIGKITELSTDLEFAGDHLHVPNLKTNGSLISISANGNYWWDTHGLDFRVTAEPLNPFLSKILPRAIDPFAILLERRLTGNLEDPKWEEISAIRDLFRQKKKSSKKDAVHPPQLLGHPKENDARSKILLQEAPEREKND